MTPREVAKAKILSISHQPRLARNRKFMSQLLEQIVAHRLFQHPALQQMQSGEMTGDMITRMHVNFRLLTKQFTDVILMAQFLTREIDRRHGEDHMPARFLIGLNLLDELGFYPGQGVYDGTPEHSHYRLFDRLLDELGIAKEGRDDIAKCSPATVALFDFVEDNLNDLLAVLMYLVVTEEEALVFSPAMRHAARLLGLETRGGYYNVHGSSQDADTEAEDDEHQNDALLVLSQYIDESDYQRATELAITYADLWSNFWDEQLELNESKESQNPRYQ